MAGPGICVLFLADTCASEVHPVFNHVAHYGYLLPNMYLFIAEITNPDSFVEYCRTWISLDITRVCEEQRQPYSLPQKNGKLPPPQLLGAGRFDTICTAVCDHCDSSTACRLCCLDPLSRLGILLHDV